MILPFSGEKLEILGNLISCLRSYIQVKSDLPDRHSDNSYYFLYWQSPGKIADLICHYKDPTDLIVS